MPRLAKIKRALVLAWLAVGLATTLACALGSGGPKRSPEEIAFEEARGRIDVVAVVPMLSATPLIDHALVRTSFENRVVRRLKEAGLRVIGPDVWDATWRKFAGDVGPVYDPTSGKVDVERHAIVRDAVMRDLVELHSVDAILRVVVDETEHLGVWGYARVCGARILPFWPSGWPSRPGQPATQVAYACLQGWLFDMNGKWLFGREAALEGIETFYMQTRAVRSPEETFRDADALDSAVEIVLEPFPVVAQDESGDAPNAAAVESKGATADDGEP